jgi:hypothetical protein
LVVYVWGSRYCAFTCVNGKCNRELSSPRKLFDPRKLGALGRQGRETTALRSDVRTLFDFKRFEDKTDWLQKEQKGKKGKTLALSAPFVLFAAPGLHQRTDSFVKVC